MVCVHLKFTNSQADCGRLDNAAAVSGAAVPPVNVVPSSSNVVSPSNVVPTSSNVDHNGLPSLVNVTTTPAAPTTAAPTTAAPTTAASVFSALPTLAQKTPAAQALAAPLPIPAPLPLALDTPAGTQAGDTLDTEVNTVSLHSQTAMFQKTLGFLLVQQSLKMVKYLLAYYGRNFKTIFSFRFF